MTIGIIGTGWGARIQVPAFRAAGLAVTALAGRDAAKTQKIAADAGIPFATGDWRDLLTRADVQVISIVTPPNLHAEMAIAALEAGKHVLCEKPTAMNAAEAEAMRAAAAAHPGLFALIDHEMRFSPPIAELQRLVASGLIGTVSYANTRLMNMSRTDPARRWNWWSDVEQGGGLLGAVGSHHIDTVRFVLGAEPETVSAALHTFVLHRPTGATAPDGSPEMAEVTADDYFQLRMPFKNGTLVTAEVHASATYEEPNTFTFVGEKGTLRWQDGKLLHAEAGKPFVDITPQHAVSPDTAGIAGEFPLATIYLGHAIKKYLAGEAGALDAGANFADGLAIQRALDAARRSHAEYGCAVTV
jgi:predicted dehydrogenase